MSDFGTHEPQPMNEGNGDANNYTSESLDHTREESDTIWRVLSADDGVWPLLIKH